MNLSVLYPDLENNFPDSIDNFDKFLDPTLSTLTAINQYYALFDIGDLAGATAILDANPLLKQMIINADNLNKLRDGILSLQRYYIILVGKVPIGITVLTPIYDSVAVPTVYSTTSYFL